jgi:FkbM family methyltransferase
MPSIKKIFTYHNNLRKNYGWKANWFLFTLKFKKDPQKNIQINGVKTPVQISNINNDIGTIFKVFFAREYAFKLNTTPKTIIDCGANIGLASLFFANEFPDATIIAIEPDANNFKYLLQNTADYPNIHCIQAAIWPRVASLDIYDPGAGNWSLQTRVITEHSATTIESITINQILERYDWERIDILKIDIEGSEKELFSSDYEYWLSRTSSIAIELHDFIDPDISKLFFKAIQPYQFKTWYSGENLICSKETV